MQTMLWLVLAIGALLVMVATLVATPLLYQIPGAGLDGFAPLCATVTLGLLTVSVGMSFPHLRGL